MLRVASGKFIVTARNMSYLFNWYSIYLIIFRDPGITFNITFLKTLSVWLFKCRALIVIIARKLLALFSPCKIDHAKHSRGSFKLGEDEFAKVISPYASYI